MVISCDRVSRIKDFSIGHFRHYRCVMYAIIFIEIQKVARLHTKRRNLGREVIDRDILTSFS